MTTIYSEPAQQAVAGFDVSEDRFTTQLRNRVSHYFPELDSSTTIVQLVDHAIRHHSQLLEFAVADKSFSRKVICKVAFSPMAMNVDAKEQKRPRLFSPPDAASNGMREYRALESIERHFSRLDDARFGVISMLDLLESPCGMLMEKCPDASLKSLLKKSTRFHLVRKHMPLHRAFSNSGAWLREFHTMPDLEHTQERDTGRDCFVDAINRFTDGLIQKLGNSAFFFGIRKRVSLAVSKHLPLELPCAVIHGDFAPRNILVGSESRVTIFDTLRRWRAPLYEDLAYLLMSVKVPGPQARSQGSLFSQRQLAGWESEFLSGYFAGGPTPLAAVRLYECLLTLEWWAAINFRQCNGTLLQGACLALSNRYLSRYVERLLADI